MAEGSKLCERGGNKLVKQSLREFGEAIFKGIEMRVFASAFLSEILCSFV